MRKYLLSVAVAIILAVGFASALAFADPAPTYVILADISLNGSVVDTEVYNKKDFPSKEACEVFRASDEFKEAEDRLVELVHAQAPTATVASRCAVRE